MPALPTFARSFDVSVTAASIVVSAFAFMRLAFAPVSGKLVSALGERPVYVWGIIVVGLSTGACAFAANYWQLLILRSLGGVGSTMFTVSAVALASNFANGWAVTGVRVSLVPLFVVEVLHRAESLAGVALSVSAGGTVAVFTGGATIWLGFTNGVPEFLAAALIGCRHRTGHPGAGGHGCRRDRLAGQGWPGAGRCSDDRRYRRDTRPDRDRAAR